VNKNLCDSTKVDPGFAADKLVKDLLVHQKISDRQNPTFSALLCQRNCA